MCTCSEEVVTVKDSEALKLSVGSEGAVKAVKAVSVLDVESQDETKLVGRVKEAEAAAKECCSRERRGIECMQQRLRDGASNLI